MFNNIKTNRITLNLFTKHLIAFYERLITALRMIATNSKGKMEVK